MDNYVGRFAPSPTGPLHMGSLVAALASWLDARAHRGCWLVRIEDVDQTRCKTAYAETILGQLAAHGLTSDQSVIWQSRRVPLYNKALGYLQANGWVYPCTCSRARILQAQSTLPKRHEDLVYPGFCRLHPVTPSATAAWRFQVNRRWPAEQHPASVYPIVNWHDRRLGQQSQNVAEEVGDFVVKRADGLFAYQLAVVVDDAEQGVTHVVRGEDLANNTPRQILLQEALGYLRPHYLHTPLVFAADHQKLSKQSGAKPLDPHLALENLAQAAGHLNLHWTPTAGHLSEGLADLVGQWSAAMDATAKMPSRPKRPA
jgi:glutamyl-Q tRNA(Asp) synthetase